MWSNMRRRPVVEGILITVVSVMLLSVAPSSSVAWAAGFSHSRARNTFPAPHATTVGESAAAEASKRQSEILASLELSQSTLEKATTDANTAIQRGMNQLKVDFVDSHRETQQMLEVMNQYIDSLRRWLKTVVVFFLLSLGGLFYMIFRPVRIQDSPVMRKRKAPEMRPAEDLLQQQVDEIWQRMEREEGDVGFDGIDLIGG